LTESQLEPNKKPIVYWYHDTNRTPDRTGKRRGKPRLRYVWIRIDERISSVLNSSGRSELSVRELFYALVSMDVLPNLKKTYGALDAHMTELRQNGTFPIDCLRDDRHPIIDINEEYYSPEDWIEHYVVKLWKIHEDYVEKKQNFPRWYEQKKYVELWTEKEAMIKRVHNIVNNENLQVRVVAFGGWAGLTILNKHVRRLKAKMAEGKDIHILYFGDLDPSGDGMDRDFAKRMGINGRIGTVSGWHLDGYATNFNVKVYFERIAVTEELINKYNLPWDPTKMSDEVQDKIENDPRTKAMRRIYGKDLATEVDALPVLYPEEFKQIVTNAVNQYFDDDVYQQGLQQHEKNYSKGYIKEVRNDWVQRLANTLADEDEESD